MSAKAGVGALGLVLLVLLGFMALAALGRRPAVAPASVQPINFPHNVHAQTYKMECGYCHADARRSATAGLPSVERCMGCHKITAADRPEIQKLTDYWNKRQPVPWVRVFKVPEFTYFPHKAHIRSKVECQTCHGPVETMTTAAGVTGQQIGNDLLNLVGLRPPPPALTMGWCVDCHKKLNAEQNTKAPLDCVACHH